MARRVRGVHHTGMAARVEAIHIGARAAFAGPAGLLADVGIRVVDGRIVEIGPAATVRPAADDQRIDFDGLLTPGLVNAHTHLELSDVARPGPLPFDRWALLIGKAGPSDGPAAAAAALKGAEVAWAEGTSHIGDVTTWPAATRAALARTPLRGVSFGEVRGMGARRNLWPDRLRAAAETAGHQPLAAGISPHAPYSLEPAGFRACVAKALAANLRLCCHIAEHADEGRFLQNHTGMLRSLWDTLGGWDANEPAFDGTPVQFANSVGLLSDRLLMAHVNHATDHDLDLIAAHGAHIAFCPRTHAYFGHAPHRYGDMLSRGINVCLGTDSAASGGDVSVLREARFLYRQGATSARTVWDMLTWRGADALGEKSAGRLEIGSRADFCIFPVDSAGRSDDPLSAMLAGEQMPTRWPSHRLDSPPPPPPPPPPSPAA